MYLSTTLFLPICLSIYLSIFLSLSIYLSIYHMQPLPALAKLSLESNMGVALISSHFNIALFCLLHPNIIHPSWWDLWPFLPEGNLIRRSEFRKSHGKQWHRQRFEHGGGGHLIRGKEDSKIPFNLITQTKSLWGSCGCCTEANEFVDSLQYKGRNRKTLATDGQACLGFLKWPRVRISV